MKIVIIVFVIFFSVKAFSEAGNQEVIYTSGTGCLGDCPVYRFYYFANGFYVFEGEEHTNVVGIRHGYIGSVAFYRILDVMKKYKFSDFDDHYGWGNRKACQELRTDYPFVTTRHQKKGKSLEVDHYTGCIGFARQSELEAIENEISKLLVAQGLIQL
jgi:hypothetical protein